MIVSQERPHNSHSTYRERWKVQSREISFTGREIVRLEAWVNSKSTSWIVNGTEKPVDIYFWAKRNPLPLLHWDRRIKNYKWMKVFPWSTKTTPFVLMCFWPVWRTFNTRNKREGDFFLTTCPVLFLEIISSSMLPLRTLDTPTTRIT